MRLLTFILLLLTTSYQLVAQDVWLHPNAGQWDDRVAYKVELDLGELLIEKNGLTYHLTDGKMTGHNHDGEHSHHNHDEDDEPTKYHVIRNTFRNSNWNGVKEEAEPSGFYRNYLKGNDPSKWRSNLYSYSSVRMKEFYPGIDLFLSGGYGRLKYSLEVAPGVDPSVIIMDYEGQDKLSIDEQGNLHIHNRFGEIVESAPVAWGESTGRKVAVEFQLQGNSVSFHFPEGYDQSDKLIIDPDLTFSTFTGAWVDNWGMTATPDANGNLFGGGIVFGMGYPVTTGAFDSNFNGGEWDVGITKFTADGTALIYSTYLGGNDSEVPSSIICNDAGELYIMGVTASANFPMAGNSYDNSFTPSPPETVNSISFQAGADLYVAKLNPTGTALLASTFVGGSGTDGLNISNLSYNYGDQIRGEINLDDNGFVYVASTTQSTNFPTQQGTQGALSGGQDAVLFKMPPTLSALNWSTYFGGTGLETGNSVAIASNGDVYIAGGTSSSNMPFNVGFDQSYDGDRDGYLARFNGFNGNVMNGTYIGANEYDQAYFVQLDIDDNVYVLGQTETNLGVTAAQWGVANSGQFIWKYNSNLTSLLWRTMIGSGSGHVEISPTAFLVSDCYDIYLSGWGGNTNVSSQATFSSSNGFPVTTHAFQTQTNGSNFYIAVLDQDATNLKYATYFGGVNSSSNHVDGGTSRFDKSGRIYHAVCASCGSPQAGFTTTPGVYAPLDNSTGSNGQCNMATFKFELSQIDAVIGNPSTVVCLPDPVIFNNNSSNGNAFFWDFGDGNTSNQVNPTHLYPGPGQYTVSLVVSDTNGCFSPDSVEFIIDIGDFNGGIIPPSGPICPGESIQLEAFGGVNYAWTPAQYLDDPTIPTPIATLTQTTDFTCVVSDSCGIDTVYVTVPVHAGAVSVSNDTSICIGNSATLSASGGVSYVWSPALYLDDPASPTPTTTPDNDITYIVEITTVEGCVLTDSVFVDVFFTPPIPEIPDLLNICEGLSVEITVGGATSYLWSPNVHISAIDTNVVTVNPPTDITYYCTFTNVCGSVLDSVVIDVIVSNIIAGGDTIICPGESAPIWAQGGVSYYWYPGATLSATNNSLVQATPTSPTMYYVLGTDQYGCTDTDSVFVDLYPTPFIQTNPDVYAFLGDQIQLSATSTTPGPYVWTPAEFLSCVVCENPVANPDQNYQYTVTYTDANGCTASDTVNIFYDPIIWVPNTFTPGDGDEHNPFFKVEGGNINEFELEIYNRWGELIVILNDMNDSWDGTYEGVPVQDGTYVWKLRVTSYEDEEFLYTGHVNVLR